MIRPDRWILGYRVFRVPQEEIARAATALLRAGLSANISPDGRFAVSSFRVRRTKEALGSLSYEISPLCGLPGFALALWHRPGALAACLVLLILALIGADRVWDVRIERDGEDPDFSSAALIGELESAGLSVGARWSRIDRDEVEASFLSSSPTVGWISITRTGTVAHVKIRKKTVYETEERPEGYANILAAEDCVIEEITVTRGYPVVSVGDTVRKGDLLISGILPAEAGGGFCRAEGSVLGRLHESVQANCARLHSEKEYGREEYRSISLEIFNFPINILKNSRNSDGNCVIIEETRVLSLPGGANLPFRLSLTRALPYRLTDPIPYSDEELVRIASSRLSSEVARRFAGADLLSIRVYGEFTADGYTMTAEAGILREVGQIAELTEN